ncbi:MULTISPECIES: SDR family NAD(P)-dependent oxidoreductase [Rheinheimera]|uniref:SDR family NAD(P)-dependent oxidoreductase n=1 Tax=Rheinheimera marina TaxID=1774958 RepID=A0ABV9JM87_9GAMM
MTLPSPHVLLTGASSGLGRTIALRLAQAGYRLSLCGQSAEKLQQSLDLLPSQSPLYARAFNLADPQQTEAFYQQACATFGPVDVLINCAGLNNSRTAADQPDWPALELMLQVNFKAPVQLMSLVLPAMRQQGQGDILNVLSTVCLFSNPGIAAYTASKAALDSYSKVLRKELTGTGVRLMSLYPGGINTQFRATARPDYLSADEVAGAVLMMLQSARTSQLHELVLRPAAETNYG